jgi:molybdate transport system substrate-binding protein
MTTRSKLAAATFAALVGVAAATTAAPAVEISLLSSTAMREVLEELIPAFERTSGHKVTITFQSGVNVSARLREGAVADLVITAGPALDALTKEGKVVAGSRVDFVRAMVGVAVRAGAPKPDIGTPDAFKNAILAAKSIGYSSGPSGIHFESVLRRLGIFDQIKGKMIRPELGVRVGTLVARGDAELGVQQINELIPIPGIDFVGPLPGDLQTALIYSTGLPTTSRQPELAKTLVKFLTSEAALPVFKKLGMEPG